MAPLLLIRADASAEIGAGHVMRCLALAQAWQDAGGSVTFVQHNCPDGLVARLHDEGAAVEHVTAEPGSAADAAETAALAGRLGADWVVVDGYVFDAEYQEALREADLRVLFVDDYGHAGHYTADLILNQNAYADHSLYLERAPHTRLLLGLDYLLLRREFWPWRGSQRAVPAQARRVLVTLGGADLQNITGLIIEALGRIEDSHLEAVVIVGAGSPHAATVRGQAGNDSRITVRQNVTDMPALLAWADVGITAGGSTCYEAALLGLPSLITVLAENQRPVARTLADAGVVEVLGDYNALAAESVADAMRVLLADAGRRAAMAEAGQRLVPGGGAQRAVQAMHGFPVEPTPPSSLHSASA